MWRYAEFLPLPEGYTPAASIGGTPLVKSRHLGAKWGAKNIYFKNDAVCFPSLSFKDRVVGTALAAAKRFGFKTIGCSSTGNLANAVAAQGAQQGLDTCVFIPADLEPAKILNTAVYGGRIIRINGNYDHVNRLCTQIADRFQFGLVNVNLRPYYAEGSKTHGYEIAEQLGWELPDNVVVPMAGGSLIGKIAKAFCELAHLGWVEPKQVKFFGAQATGCSPIADSVKRNLARFEPQKPNTIARSLAIGNPADGPFRGAADSRIWRLGGRHFRSGDYRLHQTARRKRRHLRRNRGRRHDRRHRKTHSAGAHTSRRNDRGVHHRQRLEDYGCDCSRLPGNGSYRAAPRSL